MKKLNILVLVVGVAQLVLGLAYLFFPQGILHAMGHSSIADDITYPLGMLSSRFLVYGVMLMMIARDPGANRLLILGMIWIQLIDLAVGLFYTLQGTIGLSLSGFPMSNATVIALLLWLWSPTHKKPLNKPFVHGC